MRFPFVSLLVVILLFGISYLYIQASFVCPTPITYRLGEVDERFGLSDEKIKKVLEDAANTWEDPLGRELFVYDEDSDFPVNFIFDERQQLAVTEEGWRNQLDQKEEESRTLIDRVKVMSEEYEDLREIYAKGRTAYEARLATYNSKVESYNEQGGAPTDEFEKLQAEQRELSQLSAQLLQSERELNNLADELNQLGERGNRLIDEYNAEVIKYNEVFGEASLFTQGDFRRDRINVYKFSDYEELTRVIAHEFGHALGIGHVEGEDSIMYYLTGEEEQTLNLSIQDERAFIERCGDGTEFSHVVRGFIKTALSYF